MKLINTLAFLLLLCLPLQVSAAEPSAISSDFAPLSGYIIMPIGDEYLVDLDASANLVEGDILTLVVPGEKVVHPVTKEILGSLDIAKGYLQVTRIKSGYSYAKLLTSDQPPEKGDQLRRFEQVPTRFDDLRSEKTDNQLYEQLTAALPQLDWLSAESASEPLLTFELKDKLLTVRGVGDQLLRSYPIINGELTAPPAKSIGTPFGGVEEKSRKPLEKAVDTVLSAILSSKRQAPPGAPEGFTSKQQLEEAGIWMGPRLIGSPVGIAVADFDGDGQLETALAMDNKLLIAQINGDNYQAEAELDVPPGLDLLSLDSLDLDGNGLPELYITAVDSGSLSSLVVEYRDNSYQKVIQNIRWHLRTADLPDLGKVLVGQSQSIGEEAFFGQPFMVLRDGDELVKSQELPLPNNVNMYSFAPLSDSNSEQLYAHLSQTDYLKVSTPGGEVLWESGDYYGGSETRFYNTDKQHTEEVLEPVYINSRLLTTDKGEILVAQNDGLRVVARFRMFKDSRLISLSWNGHALVENWRTAGQSGYLADFAVADANNDGEEELVMAMKFKHKGMLKDARSTVVTYRLN